MKLGSGLMFMVSVEGLAAAVRTITAGFQRLPDILKLVIGLAAVTAIAHPKSRQKISNFFTTIPRQLFDPNSSVSNLIRPIANEFLSAQKTATSARLQIDSARPPAKRLSALIHARAICVASEAPLAEAEIERRMRSQGYVSNSPSFQTYLRRILRTDRRFREVSPRTWAICREKVRAR